MRDKQVEKIKKNLRQMNYWQRIEIMDWLKSWYAAVKEEEELEREEQEEPCICIPDEPNVDCRWCY
jgi:hypothetical protein